MKEYLEHHCYGFHLTWLADGYYIMKGQSGKNVSQLLYFDQRKSLVAVQNLIKMLKIAFIRPSFRSGKIK